MTLIKLLQNIIFLPSLKYSHLLTYHERYARSLQPLTLLAFELSRRLTPAYVDNGHVNGSNRDCKWLELHCYSIRYIYIKMKYRKMNDKILDKALEPMRSGYPLFHRLQIKRGKKVLSEFVKNILMDILRTYKKSILSGTQAQKKIK